MEIVLAQPKDNEPLIKFLQQSPVPGLVDLSIARQDSFFKIYDIQSKDYDTFIIKDENDNVHGVFTLLFREAMIDDVPQIIGYTTDLRLGVQREALVTWARNFLPLMQESMHKRSCKYMFSILSSGQSFLKARAVDRQIPRYQLLRRFDIVTINGRIPYLTGPLPTLKVRAGQKKDLDALAGFIRLKSKGRPLAYSFAGNEFEKMIYAWPGFDISNFLIAFDSLDNIVGCVAPWDSSLLQKYYVINYHGSIVGYRKIFYMGSLLGISRQLPAKNRPLNFKFLSHLYVNNHDIFQTLLYHAYKQCRKKEFLTYVQFEGDIILSVPKYFISWSAPFGLYNLGAPEMNRSLQPSPLLPAPILEPALI